MSGANPFDYVASIQKTKKDLIRDSENPELAAKGYVPYLTNKALSYHVDSIMYANDMNQFHHLDPDMQYAYYINTIRSMNRKHTWLKKANDDKIDLVQQYYQVNAVRAQEILSIIGEKGLQEITRRLQQGGTGK